MVHVRNRITVFLGVLLTLTTSLSLGSQDAVRQFIACFRAEPSPEELCMRLSRVIECQKGTEVEDDAMLALGEALLAGGDVEKAIETLERAAADTEATRIDPSYFRQEGRLLPQRKVVLREIRRHYARFPDFTSDRALLALARAYHKSGDLAKAWEAYERLRIKYPHGDRVKEDLQFIEEFRNRHPELRKRFQRMTPALAARRRRGFDWDVGVLLSELFLVRRRPHLSGLKNQRVLCHMLGKPPEEHISLLKQTVSTYGDFLTRYELTIYCRRGLAQIESVKGKAEGQILKELEEAGKVFNQSMELLAVEEIDGEQVQQTGRETEKSRR